MAHVAQHKKDKVKDLVALMKVYPIIASVNLENLPAPQLQNMRAQLRGNVVLRMTKRRIFNIAIDKAKDQFIYNTVNRHACIDIHQG